MGCTHNSFKCSQRRKSMLLLRYISPLEPFSSSLLSRARSKCLRDPCIVCIAEGDYYSNDYEKDISPPALSCSTFPPLQAMHRWTWPNTAGFFLTTGSSHYSCNEINFLDLTGAAHITALSAPKERNPSCCSGTLFGWNRPRYSP
ncbi:hypothetical protein CDAR_369161 [Caerostris darwini]|uniref:Uncharacterized protein n=1 Tax=Caerostris darwini TaxID=1538125 RepID=A0AAV4WM97_9ARAC|nr:hypothetical protein CDAR_369161 [Caerostris darwini]